MGYQTILFEQAGDIAVLTLNQPETRNGLTAGMQAEIQDVLDQVVQQESTRALILTGAGKAFCSGADLGWLGSAGDSSIGNMVATVMEESSNPLILALQNLPVPVVAAVNGAAAGAGFGLALAADVTICGRSAFFLSTFLSRLGIVPDMGTTHFLSSRLGHARAMGVMMLGERLPADKAEEWGMIWACVDDDVLMTEAHRIAVRLANAPSHAIVEARQALHHAARNELSAQLDYEKERQRELLDLPSFREGVRAFFEKREPVFRR
jgi:2-(1,2-epoxy-1,2-dihydrophenyl)acetyl-CoA isomerase